MNWEANITTAAMITILEEMIAMKEDITTKDMVAMINMNTIHTSKEDNTIELTKFWESLVLLQSVFWFHCLCAVLADVAENRELDNADKCSNNNRHFQFRCSNIRFQSNMFNTKLQFNKLPFNRYNNNNSHRLSSEYQFQPTNNNSRWSILDNYNNNNHNRSNKKLRISLELNRWDNHL